MAEETIISWNLANWITVILMAVLGFALIGAAIKVVNSRKGA
jgi:hypothetical protein